jgi:signal transduction histidine kinase
VRTIADEAARQRPPLTKRLGPGQWAALDYVVGAVVGVILFVSIRHSVTQVAAFRGGVVRYQVPPLTWPLATFLVAVAVVAVALRRRRPVLMLGVLLAGSVLVTTLTGPDGGSLTYFLPVAYVLYLVAATYERRQAAVRVIAAVLATLVADAVLLELTGRGSFARGGLVPIGLCVIIAWSAGYTVRQRRRYAVRLQGEAASKAVAEERLRIARELHDVVAHSMSVIAVQAGYGQYVIDTQPADARNALGAIQATSREALDEMRRMLGALRQADETDAAARAGGGAPAAPGQRDLQSAPLFPAPGLADLDRLLARTASAGVRVDVTRCGEPRELPASIDMSAYRIVQEALTNVVKHAQTSSCQVLIGYGHDELILEVTDNGAGLPELAGAGVSHHRAVTGYGAGNLFGGGATVLDARPAGSAPSWILAADPPDGGTGVGPGGAGSALGGTGRALGGTGRALGGTGRALGGTGRALGGTGRALGGADRGFGGGGHGFGGGGHGIIGMRERVSLLGGEFSAGPRSGYGFQVSAHIPLPAGSA